MKQFATGLLLGICLTMLIAATPPKPVLPPELCTDTAEEVKEMVLVGSKIEAAEHKEIMRRIGEIQDDVTALKLMQTQR